LLIGLTRKLPARQKVGAEIALSIDAVTPLARVGVDLLDVLSAAGSICLDVVLRRVTRKRDRSSGTASSSGTANASCTIPRVTGRG
jgi:hypothetical protein